MIICFFFYWIRPYDQYPSLQPSLSASSDVRPSLISGPSSSSSRNATCFDQDDAVGLDAFDYRLLEKRMLLEVADACVQPNAPSRSSHLRGPSIMIPPAWKPRSTGSSCRASLSPAAPTPQRRPKDSDSSPPRLPLDPYHPSQLRLCRCCRGCQCDITSRLHRLCLSANGARQAPPPVTSTASILWRRGGPLFTSIRRSIQIDYSDAAFTATVVLAGPRPEPASAHNKTLQF